MTYQLILFDVDGTLINSFVSYQTIMQTILPSFNVQASKAELQHTFSLSVEASMDYFHIDLSNKESLLTQYRQELNNPEIVEPLYPDIMTVIDELRQQNILTGIVTSRSHADVQRLEPDELKQKMDIIVDANAVQNPKPAADPIIKAMTILHIDREQTLYIGDAIVDQTAANAANVDFGVANWGADPSLTFSKPTYSFETPKQLLNIL